MIKILFEMIRNVRWLSSLNSGWPWRNPKISAMSSNELERRVELVTNESDLSITEHVERSLSNPVCDHMIVH